MGYTIARGIIGSVTAPQGQKGTVRMELYTVTAVYKGNLSETALVHAEDERAAIFQVDTQLAGELGYIYACQAKPVLYDFTLADPYPRDTLAEDSNTQHHNDGEPCPTCNELSDICRMEAPYGGVMSWCACGTVFLSDTDGTREIGSTADAAARLIANAITCRDYIRNLPPAYNSSKEMFIHYIDNHCPTLWNDYQGDSGSIRTTALVLSFRNYRKGLMPDYD